MSPVRNTFVIAGAVAACLLAAGSTQAQSGGVNASGCRLVFEGGSDQWLIQYDPFAQEQAVRHFDVAVVNQGDAPCSGAVRVDLQGEQFGLAMVGAAERINYALIDERGGADVTPHAGRSARRIGARPVDLAPGERGLLRYSLTVGTPDFLASGLYSQSAVLSMEGPEGFSIAERPITLGVQVASAALMGLKGEFARQGGVATIDLGELREGRRSLATSLYVLSTGGYSVSVISTNGGKLRQGATDWYVPYGLSLDDNVMDLASGDRLDVVSRRPRADDYRLSINVGSVTGKRAGDYSDTLTFTIAAL